MTDDERASLQFNALVRIIERLNAVIIGTTLITTDCTHALLSAGSNATSAILTAYVRSYSMDVVAAM